MFINPWHYCIARVNSSYISCVCCVCDCNSKYRYVQIYRDTEKTIYCTSLFIASDCSLFKNNNYYELILINCNDYDNYFINMASDDNKHYL